MSKQATENLFLLEFLVDSVKLDPTCDCSTPPGETCVSFQFLDNGPLDVCEGDFTPGITYEKDAGRLKSGKSCLFSLTSEQVDSAQNQFDVTVLVMKRMQPGWLPDKIDVGTSLISIANLFEEMIQSIQVPASSDSPTSKTLKDVFDVLNTDGTPVGKIGIYIRLSCFGKLIVTQFQMNFDDKSVLFKDKEGKSLYRYKKAAKGATSKIDEMRAGAPGENMSCPMGAAKGGMAANPSCPMKPCDANGTPAGRCPPSPSPYNDKCPFDPCDGSNQNPYREAPQFNSPGMFGGGYNNPNVPCNECGQLPAPPCGMPYGPQQNLMMNQSPYGQMNTTTPCMECGQLPNPPCAPQGGGFMGLPMGMGGMGGMMPQSMCGPCCGGNQGMPGNPPPTPEGNYQEIGATMGGNSLTIRVHKDKDKLETADESVSEDDGCGCGGSSKPKKKQRPQAPQGCPCSSGPPKQFNMSPGVNQGGQNLPFSFKMGGCGQAAANNVVVNPPVQKSPDGTAYTELSDPNKEVFILRIGKKSEGVDKKSNLELELCTPKGPDLKPPPKKETRDTQFDPKDAEAAAAAGGKGKGKGDKAGGKGKDKGGKKGAKGGKGKGKGKKK